MESIIPLALLYIDRLNINPLFLGLVYPFAILLFVYCVFEKKENLSLFLLVSLTSSIVFLRTLSNPIPFYSSFEDVETLGGVVLSSPSYKGGNTQGFNIRIENIGDSRGNWESVEGKVYVVAANSDVDKGDKIYVRGSIKEGYFFAHSVYIRKRNPLGRGRRRLLSLLMRSLDEGSGGNLTFLLLTGMTLDGGKEIQESGRDLGLSHLFALSGMHLAFIHLLLGFPLEKALGRKGRVISSLILFVFVYINAFRPSLLRAYILFLLSPFFPITYAHALSFLIMMKICPFITQDYGAILSFSSLSGILFTSSLFKNRQSMILPTLGALSATVPLSLSLFGSWSLYSLLLSIPGSIVIEIVFFLVIIRLFIPKMDYIVGLIYDCIIKLPSKLPVMTQYDLSLYWPILITTLFLIFTSMSFPFLKRWIIIKVCGTSITTVRRKSREY